MTGGQNDGAARPAVGHNRGHVKRIMGARAAPAARVVGGGAEVDGGRGSSGASGAIGGTLRVAAAVAALGTLGPVAGLGYQAGLTPPVFSGLRAGIGAGMLGLLIAGGRLPSVRFSTLGHRERMLPTVAIVANAGAARSPAGSCAPRRTARDAGAEMPGTDPGSPVQGRSSGMKAIVVYESFWGNTADIARAIAEGIGPDARALSTAEATATVVADADLIVAGAPVIGFQLPSETMRESLRSEAKAPRPADLSAPSMRSWLDALPAGQGRSAAFETRISWSPGGAAGAITKGLARAGYPEVAKAGKFVVKGRYGPLKDGEIQRALAWGAEIARAMR